MYSNPYPNPTIKNIATLEANYLAAKKRYAAIDEWHTDFSNQLKAKPEEMKELLQASHDARFIPAQQEYINAYALYRTAVEHRELLTGTTPLQWGNGNTAAVTPQPKEPFIVRKTKVLQTGTTIELFNFYLAECWGFSMKITNIELSSVRSNGLKITTNSTYNELLKTRLPIIASEKPGIFYTPKIPYINVLMDILKREVQAFH